MDLERLLAGLAEPVEPMDLDAPARVLVSVPWTTPTTDGNAFARTLELADAREAGWPIARQEPVEITYVTVADAVEAFLGSLSDDERQMLHRFAGEIAEVSKADPERMFDVVATALASRVYAGEPSRDENGAN